MMRLFLIAGLILVSMPAMAQVEVKSYSTTNTTIVPGQEGAATPTRAGEEPAWIWDVRERIDNGFILKNGRSYVLDKNTLTENIKISSVSDMDNIFDFDNGLMFVKMGGASRATEVISFSELAGGRAEQLKDYACFIGRNSRASEAAFFVTKHCPQ